MQNREKQLLLVEVTLNNFLAMGISPPKTCDGLVKLFCGRVSKETLISFFENNEVKWHQGFDPTQRESYDEYKSTMNASALVYMSK